MDTARPPLELLRENRLFAGMPEAAIAECAVQFTILHTGRRQELFRQGDPCNHVYCLLSGCVRLGRLAEDGSDFTTRVVSGGELFGEDALFDGEVHPSTATSLRDGTVAVCCATRMKSLLKRHPALAINIARYFLHDRNRTLDRLERLSCRPVRERLLALLRELARQDAAGEAADGNYEVKLTHSELASLIGSTRETVSSELSKLVQAGLVSRIGRKIFVNVADEAAA